NNKVAIVDKNSCMECGACKMNCPMSAITVEANVGCAAAIIWGWLTGKKPTCGCSDDSSSSCC
ncbi:MAG: 4Fe-4S binding protein, partial [Spirochaetaceae bacterium]|nr:4Fe-4S binding protein [Spirochaetaceae bacterium]